MSKKFNDRTFRKIEKIYSVYLPNEFKKVYGNMEELPENWYDWSDDWGEVPNNLELTKREILSRLTNSPTLLPIFGHRYIVSYNTPISPVFSVVGSDIIYYSKSLTDYWHGITISREINLSDLPKIPFWSDIAQ